MFVTESSYKSVLINNIIFCIVTGILHSFCQNNRFNKQSIKMTNKFINDFGNTLTSYSSLVYSSCLNDIYLIDAYRQFLFGILLCFLSYQISLTFMDRILNNHKFYGKIAINAKPLNINWKYIQFINYFMIGITVFYYLYHFDIFTLNTCLTASILAYILTFYFKYSSELICIITRSSNNFLGVYE